MNAIEKVRELSAKLHALGSWQRYVSQHDTDTSKLLIESAAWLRELANEYNMFGQGIIGCTDGPGCDSDHK